VFLLKEIGWIDSIYAITVLPSIPEVLAGTVLSLNQTCDLFAFLSFLMCRPSGDPLLDATVCFSALLTDRSSDPSGLVYALLKLQVPVPSFFPVNECTETFIFH